MLDLLEKTFVDKEHGIVAVVRSTYNYDMFAKVNGNRIVDKGNYKKLKQSILEPMILNVSVFSKLSFTIFLAINSNPFSTPLL